MEAAEIDEDAVARCDSLQQESCDGEDDEPDPERGDCVFGVWQTSLAHAVAEAG